MTKKTCWNCKWINGNNEPCDFGEITTSKSEPCDCFKDDPNFPEQIE